MPSPSLLQILGSKGNKEPRYAPKIGAYRGSLFPLLPRICRSDGDGMLQCATQEVTMMYVWVVTFVNTEAAIQITKPFVFGNFRAARKTKTNFLKAMGITDDDEWQVSIYRMNLITSNKG